MFDSHFQRTVKDNGIFDVPPVTRAARTDGPSFGYGASVIGCLGQSHAVGIVEVVLRSCPLKSGCGISVDVKHVIAFAPPTERRILNVVYSTDILALARGFQNDIIFSLQRRVSLAV